MVVYREAVIADAGKLEAFLRQHFETTMFMRGNLRDYGIGDTASDYAMRYFLREVDGAIQGVGAVANVGALMMQANEGLTELAAFMQKTLPADKVYGVILGGSDQVETLRNAFGLGNAKATMDEVEPLFTLTLANLTYPATKGASLRMPVKADMPMLIDWNYAYAIETSLRKQSDNLRQEIAKEVEARMAKGRYRLLIINGEPVAQTGFNAILPDAVQIGGVFTPPEHRRNGYGRLAVALHLEEARARGVKQAILFSANEYASRAYRAIGFEQIGHYTLTIFAPPETEG